MDRPETAFDNADVDFIFTSKPLGIHLVPSTRLYGTWQVGNVLNTPWTRHHQLEVGDVLMAINGDHSVTQLSNHALQEHLDHTPCPLTITFRKPRLHLHRDSATLSTALYPHSAEYDSVHSDMLRKDKLWNPRVSAAQWRTV
jgi:hypothetical protein